MVASRNIIRAPGGGYLVSFPYSADVVQAVREIPGRKFVPASKTWHIPDTAAAMTLLPIFAVTHKFMAEDGILQEAARITTQASNLLTASTGTEAEIDIPGLRRALYPFQKAGVAYAVMVKRCLIADEPGLGKTIQALATIEHLNAYPALVICPAGLKYNWARECRHVAGRSVSIIQAGEFPCLDTDIVIVNYDLLHKLYRILIDHKWAAIIADESQYIKAKSQRTKACLKLADRVPVRLALTGTPITNRPVELISQLTFLGKFSEFGNWASYTQKFCAAYKDRWGWRVDGASNLAELHQRLQKICMVRRTKEQVLTELPPKTYTTLPVEIDNRREYRKAEADVIQWIGQRAIEDAKFLASIALFSKVEQQRLIAQHRASAEERAAKAKTLVLIGVLRQVTAKGKTKAAVEWVTDMIDTGQKLVVFGDHIATVESIRKAFVGCAAVTGNSDRDERQANIDRFQSDPECLLIVCSFKAGGLGITLTAASNVFFLEFPWTPAAMEHAANRVHRIGQRDAVNIWSMVGENTIDETIVETLAKKQTVSDAAIDGIEEIESTNVFAALMRALKEQRGT